ncbi:MAG: hypothetical protein AAGI34_15715 [Pseudomonadota bacterium]
MAQERDRVEIEGATLVLVEGDGLWVQRYASQPEVPRVVLGPLAGLIGARLGDHSRREILVLLRWGMAHQDVETLAEQLRRFGLTALGSTPLVTDALSYLLALLTLGREDLCEDALGVLASRIAEQARLCQEESP